MGGFLIGNKSRIFWFLAFSGVAAAYFFAREAYYIGIFNDDAQYILGARSLLSGGYVELFNPRRLPLAAYFPGYPAVLALWMLAFSGSESSLRLVSVALSLCLLLVSFLYFRKKLTPVGFFYFFLLLAFNSLNLSLAGALLSDVTFALFVILALYFYEESGQKGGLPFNIALGLLCGFLFLIRPLGACFAAGIIADMALKKRRREAFACGAAALLPALLWSARNMAARGMTMVYISEFFSTQKTSGAGLFAAAGGAFGHFSRYFFDMFSYTVFRPPPNPGFETARIIITLALSSLFLWGTIKDFQKRRACVIGCAFYMAAVSLWPMYASRYLVPLTPFFLYFMLKGVEYAVERSSGAKPMLHIIGLAGLALCISPANIIIRASIFKNNPASRAPVELFDWIERNTARDAVFLAVNNAGLYLNTGRYALPMRRYERAGELVAEAERSGITHILSQDSAWSIRSDSGRAARDPLAKERMDELILETGRFERVFASAGRGYSVYKIKP